MKTKIEIVLGDITESITEAIVNAANNHLWMGSGVAGAIKRKGGQIIEDEAMKKGPIPVGQAIATSAGNLHYKYIIHSAGMGQDLKTSPEIIYKTTINTLLLADKLQLGSIAFPAIGTGVGGLSSEECAEVMIKAAVNQNETLEILKLVQFVLFDQKSYDIFKRVRESL